MSSKKIVAIHQPNFFPWLGYFDKIARAHKFLLMDNVQFPKTGSGTWINRVQVIVNGKAAWLTVPIVRSFHGTRLIREMVINDGSPWRIKLLKTLQMNYAKAPYFKEIFPFISDLVMAPITSISEYNIAAIRAIVETLELDPSKFILGSELSTEGQRTDLLITMVKAIGGTAYLAGGGASGYQEDEKFHASGIELIYQNFQHPIYPQFNTQDFIPGMSILDALMNLGLDGTKRLILKDLSKSQYGER